MYSIDVV